MVSSRDEALADLLLLRRVRGSTGAIAVLDASDGESRWVGKQLQAVREGRVGVDEIWELNEPHSVARLLESLPRATDGRGIVLGRIRARESSEMMSQMRRSRSAAHCLPMEVLENVWDRAITEEQDGYDSQEFILFQILRLVSRSVLYRVEKRHPRVALRFVSRVARHLIHVVGPRGNRFVFARMLYDSRDLFGRAPALNLLLRGHELHAFNELLAVCPNVISLTIYYEEDDPAFDGLDLRRNTCLATLQVVGVFQEDWMREEGIPPKARPAARDLLVIPEQQSKSSWYNFDFSATIPSGESLPPQFPPSVKTLEIVKGRHTFDWPSAPRPPQTDTEVPRHSLTSLLWHPGPERVLLRDMADFPHTTGVGAEGRWIEAVQQCVRNGVKDLQIDHTIISWTSRIAAVTPNRLEALAHRDDKFMGTWDEWSLALLFNLVSLDLSNSPLTRWSMGLAEHTRLRVLNLHGAVELNYQYSPGRRASFIAAFSADFALNRSLEQLYLGGSWITDDELAVMRLGRHKGLRLLSLVCNRITNVGLDQLHFDLTHHSHTHVPRTVILGGNPATEGARYSTPNLAIWTS